MSSQAQKLRSSQSHHSDEEAPAWAVTLQEKTISQLKDHIRDEIKEATAKIDQNISELQKYLTA
jgi:hypothetical protein